MRNHKCDWIAGEHVMYPSHNIQGELSTVFGHRGPGLARCPVFIYKLLFPCQTYLSLSCGALFAQSCNKWKEFSDPGKYRQYSPDTHIILPS